MSEQGTQRTPLQRLARACGVLPRFRDGFGERRAPSDEAVTAVLQALGAPIRGRGGAAQALAACREARWKRALPPVVVSWLPAPFAFRLRLPRRLAEAPLDCALEFEDGATRSWTAASGEARVERAARVHGADYRVVRLAAGFAVPAGCHALRVKAGRQTWTARVLRAPRAAPALERTWGVFLPLYALRTQRSLGAGDLGDLGAMLDWVHGLGGGLAGILPLLASFPDNPSPYTPVSRLFWNEFYLDPRLLPEWSSCPAAQAWLESAEARRALAQTRQARHVDFQTAGAVKRKAVELLAGALAGQRLQEYEQALENDPALRRYAAFRARVEQQSGGVFPSAEAPRCDPRRYHGYAQWAMRRQLRAAAEKARANGPGLYLDLPLGVHPQGFDRLEHPRSFAAGVTVGAPPDRFFSKGQNWGFAPLNPAAQRESGHRYFIDCIRAQMQYAGVLRIDHVMGLHRQYWIPSGCAADQGVYVQYPAEELYAVLCLEAQRRGAAIVGEDLGTVPRRVRGRMRAHGLQRMYAAQFEMRPDAASALPQPPPDAAASVGTHDTPTFAAFWNGDDVRDRQALGLLEARHAGEAAARRQKLKDAARRYFGKAQNAAAKAILEECLYALGASQAACVIVNVEDLWGEEMPQNTPGTDRERANWSRRARYALEEFSKDPEILRILRKLNALRNAASAARRAP